MQKWKLLIPSLLILATLVALVFAVGFNNLPTTVNVTTSSEYLNVYLWFRQHTQVLDSGWYGRHYLGRGSYLVITVFKNPLSQLNFSNAPPGGKVGYKLLVANIANVTLYNVTWSSTLSQVTTKIADDFPPIYKAFFWKEDANYRYYIVYENVAASWNTTLEPDDAILATYQIQIAWDAPMQTYSWTLSINSAQ